MKKIAILTKYYKNYNYGGMLQGYALHRVITEMGKTCDIVSYNASENSNPVYPSIIQQSKQYGFSSIVQKICEKCVGKFRFLIGGILSKRESLFDEFMKHGASAEVYTDKTLKKLNNEYEMFISGSDQIWNPNAVRSLYLQEFVSDEKQKIAYAASIGRDRFSKLEIDVLVPAIKQFDFLGVREKTAKDLLSQYIEKNIQIVIDPTMLLSAKEWEKISAKRLVNENYALFYFFSDSLRIRNEVKNFCIDRNLKEVFIPYAKQEFNFNDRKGEGIRLYDAGPAEFISAIKYADYVFTDSFHGAVFSIIHGKQFFVFERNKAGHVSMNSRLHDLLDSFDLNNRLIDVEHINDIYTLNPIEYVQVFKRLRKFKKDSLLFLKKAIGETDYD